MALRRFIGDIHGNFERYKKILKASSNTIQVGDLGVGFRISGGGPRDGEIRENPPHYLMSSGDHMFIRGNHDNPGICRNHSQWIADGTVIGDMMFCGGGFSIDREFRTEGYTWWPEEELSIVAFNYIIDVYRKTKPRIMVTHEAPAEVGTLILSRIPTFGGQEIKVKSRTALAFQEMWNFHQPDIWIFGHYHISFDHVLKGGREKGTRFICLAEFEWKDIEV